MAIINRIGDFQDEMTAWRRDLHAHPEIGFEETRTAAVVADKLRSFGLDEVHTGLAEDRRRGRAQGGLGRPRHRPARRHGRAADRGGDRPALRLDPPGRMHACGHDGHTTMLLGAAKYLAETRDFDGTAVFIFQPAEEGWRAAA